MIDRIVLALAFTMTAGSAFAGSAPVSVPEPASIAVFGAAAVGAYASRKFKNRTH